MFQASVLRYCLMLSFLIHFALSQGSETGGESCIEARNDVTDNATTGGVYLGWPLLISCRQLGEDIYDQIYDNYGYDSMDEQLAKPSSCIITDLARNVTVFNKSRSSVDDLDDLSFKIPVVDNMTGLLYRLQAQVAGGLCFYEIRRYKITEFPRYKNCAESLANAEQDGTAVEVESERLVRLKIFGCEVPQTAQYERKLHYYDGLNFTTRWYRNCSEIEVEKNKASTPWTKKTLRKIDFDDAGIYTCAVTYNGMTTYIIHYHLCVKHRLTQSQPRILCDKTVFTTQVGDQVKLTCGTLLGQGDLDVHHVTVHWEQTYSEFPSSAANVTTCFNLAGTNGTSAETARASCNYVSVGQQPTSCFLRLATNEETRRAPKLKLEMNLVIENVQKSDLGKYTVTVQTNVQGRRHANKTVVLSLEPYRAKPEIAAAFLGLLSVIVCLLLVALYLQLQLRVLYKRYFGKIEQEKKDHDVYLSYYFSQEMDCDAQNSVRQSVKSVNETLEGLGFKVFDDHRDGISAGFESENVSKAIRQSRRMLVILTSTDYIRDGWSVFKLQKSFHESIQSKSRLIFVVGPGIKKHIIQQSSSNKTCKIIKNAMKYSYVIKWSHDDKFNKRRFRFELENAMPKLATAKESAAKREDARSIYVARRSSSTALLPQRNEFTVELNDDARKENPHGGASSN